MSASSTDFTPEQISRLDFLIKERKKSGVTTILIVEDQPLSRTILEEVLKRSSFLCESVINGTEAITYYAENAPCITFLDVELPDINGHTLAALFKKHDPEGHIVMVTANNYAKDVDMAKTNKVQGFVVKPYNRQKILDSVAAYERKKQPK